MWNGVQTEKWLDVALLEEESPLPSGWLLLEEAEGWEDHAGRSHEAEGAGDRGKQSETTNSSSASTCMVTARTGQISPPAPPPPHLLCSNFHSPFLLSFHFPSHPLLTERGNIAPLLPKSPFFLCLDVVLCGGNCSAVLVVSFLSLSFYFICEGIPSRET